MTGIDPAQQWRGRYDSRDGALGFVREAGGLIRTFAAAAAVSGLQRAHRPVLGAVGVIRCDDPFVPIMGAVCIGGGFWSTVAPVGGFIATRTRAVVAWELPPNATSPAVPDRSGQGDRDRRS